MHNREYRIHGTARNPKGIVTVIGQRVSLRVRRHQLEITDGFPFETPQETRRITRATCRLERILFLAGSGFLTVDAIDFCAVENGVPIVAVDQSGRLRWTLLPGKGGEGQAGLRRSQALAPFTEVGLEIARWLVARKIAGQRDVLRDLAGRVEALKGARPKCTIPEALAILETILARVKRATTIPSLRQVEAEAADIYWSGWTGLPLHFAPPSYRKRVPAHWTSFRGRGSPLNRGNRNAVTPLAAITNYAYALLEAEARIACHEAGLDSYLGVSLHSDQDARRSLLYDLMEPCRPVADRLVLNLVLGHAFRPGELWSLRDGRCRLDQDLCARLWSWMPEFRKALGPVMTFLLSRLRQGPRYGERVAFRLVEVPPNVQTRAPLGQKRWARQTPAQPIQPARVCRACGVLLEGLEDRMFCDDCLPQRHAELGAQTAAAGRRVLAQMRVERRDPAHGGAAARLRGAKIGQHNRERARWRCEESAAANPEVFRREILPRLRGVPLGRIARALSVSVGYASFIRRGLCTPARRHWEALRTLVENKAS